MPFWPICCESDAKFVQLKSFVPVTGLECSYGKKFIPVTEISVAKTEISVTGPARALIWTHRYFYKEKSGEARSRKPSQPGWQGSYEEALCQYTASHWKNLISYGFVSVMLKIILLRGGRASFSIFYGFTRTDSISSKTEENRHATAKAWHERRRRLIIKVTPLSLRIFMQKEITERLQHKFLLARQQLIAGKP